jgi:sterol desaturase/sphingolipid hydroxylase (fatty acid hydroxylase superfamily)
MALNLPIVLAHEGEIRLAVFAALLLALALAERVLAPRDSNALGSTRQRWVENFGLMLIDTALLRVAFPLLAVQFASYRALEFGALPGLLSSAMLPFWLAVLLGVLALDLVIYGQHRLFHKLPWLWRLHAVHHSDQDFDVSLAVRFHPLEALLSMAIKLTAIALLAPPAIAVLAFELLLSIGALLTHTRLQLPRGLERVARWLIITPSMHRLHHSVEIRLQQRNFGSLLAVWDYIFGSATHASDAAESTLAEASPDYAVAVTPAPAGVHGSELFLNTVTAGSVDAQAGREKSDSQVRHCAFKSAIPARGYSGSRVESGSPNVGITNQRPRGLLALLMLPFTTISSGAPDA